MISTKDVLISLSLVAEGFSFRAVEDLIKGIRSPPHFYNLNPELKIHLWSSNLKFNPHKP